MTRDLPFLTAATIAAGLLHDGTRTVLIYSAGVITVGCFFFLMAFLAVETMRPKLPPLPAPDAPDAEFDAWCRQAMPELYRRSRP